MNETKTRSPRPEKRRPVQRRLTPEERERMLRPYKIAKACGAKFYFGSDAHHPQRFENVKSGFELIRDELELKETDKFIIPERK